MPISGATRICQIIGHPVWQVRSPELFNAHAERIGADVALIPVDVAPAELPAFIASARGWRNSPGFVVTVPHKRTVAAQLDALTDRADRLQAVNVVRREADGRLTGDMVDGLGFVAAAVGRGFEIHGCRALVIGTGGAGSAIVDALCERGVARLAMRDIDSTRLDAMRLLFSTTYPEVEITEGDDGPGNFDLVVNASPAGMGGTGELPLATAELDALHSGALVADVVTKPRMTPFLLAAQARGCRVQTGPDMVAGQLEILGRFMRAWT